jgi:bacteriocin-like protein
MSEKPLEQKSDDVAKEKSDSELTENDLKKVSGGTSGDCVSPRPPVPVPIPYPNNA